MSVSSDYRAKKEAEIRQVEKQAQQRIEDARKRAATVEKQYQAHLEGIKDEYMKMSEAERERTLAALLDQRNKGYERVRDLQRDTEKQYSEVRREGEKQLADLDSHFRMKTFTETREGEQELRALLNRQHQMMEYEKKNGSYLLDTTRTRQAEELSALHEMHHDRFTQTTQAKEKQYQEIVQEARDSQMKSQEKFEKDYQNKLSEHDRKLGRLQQKSFNALDSLRESTARKLEAYSTRQDDPFYRMVEIDAELDETSDAYILTAQIPSHEQDRVSVSVQGDQLVIAGSRRNREIREPAPGEKISTASFQSYSRTFPLQLQVEPRHIQREYGENEVRVILPKKGTYAPPPKPHQAAYARRTEIPRPEFPANLPLKQGPSRGGSGSGTLS